MSDYIDRAMLSEVIELKKRLRELEEENRSLKNNREVDTEMLNRYIDRCKRYEEEDTCPSWMGRELGCNEAPMVEILRKENRSLREAIMGLPRFSHLTFIPEQVIVGKRALDDLQALAQAARKEEEK